MARTADPNRYLTIFQEQLQESLDQYIRLEEILEAANAPAAVRKTVAEDTAFRLGALWEVFQGRWHISAVSREPKRFVRRIQKELSESLENTWARTALEVFAADALTVPARPTVAQIETLLDPKGYNMTFQSAKAWRTSSIDNHADVFKRRVIAVEQDAEAESFLHLLKKLRNCLAHGSENSKTEFNQACRARTSGSTEGLAGDANAPLVREQRQITDVGAYLRARQPAPGGPRRLETLHRRLSEVAEVLRVPSQGLTV